MSKAEKKAMMAEVLNAIAHDMKIPRKRLPLRPVDFVFLWWEDLEYGVFVTADFYEFLDLFHAAKNNARTWGEFINGVGDYGRRFVNIFTEADELRPLDTDLIEDIQDDVFILSDYEFPITQCVDETYNTYVEILPPLGAGRKIRTEYGMDIGLYLKSDYLLMKEHMDHMGYNITSKLSPFLCDIYNY
jgi:hypothetical protein